MNVASLQFLAFALGAALLLRLASLSQWSSIVFLCLNLSFLASFSTNPRQWLPMGCFLLAGYAAVRLLQRRQRWSLFLLLISVTLAAFVWLKKYSFLPNSLFITTPYMTIGLSYMFFRLAHLMIDSYGRDITVRIDPITYLNYLINFTALISGPIERFEDFVKWNLTPAQPTLRIVGLALERIVAGYFKVVIVSGLLFYVHRNVLEAFDPVGDWPQKVAQVGVLGAAYSFYLYYNFSGYMDIVIGVADLFGLTLPENFNRPFSANNFLEFWRRWHMTLSNWLRYYVYNPLLQRLMEAFPSPRITPMLGMIAIFVTFFLIGFWHGQTGVYAIYGLLLGVGVSGNMLYQIVMSSTHGRKEYRNLSANFYYQMTARGLTFAWFTLSLFCFWADWNELDRICSGLGWIGVVSAFASVAALAALGFTIIEVQQRLTSAFWKRVQPVLKSRYARTVYTTTSATLVVGTILLLTHAAPTIVYEKF